jgi:hypothetical protein
MCVAFHTHRAQTIGWRKSAARKRREIRDDGNVVTGVAKRLRK